MNLRLLGPLVLRVVFFEAAVKRLVKALHDGGVAVAHAVDDLAQAFNATLNHLEVVRFVKVVGTYGHARLVEQSRQID